MSRHFQENTEYLYAAAAMAESQALENPGLGIPLDPDLAEFMGLFQETALCLDDLSEDIQLALTPWGDAFYDE